MIKYFGKTGIKFNMLFDLILWDWPLRSLAIAINIKVCTFAIYYNKFHAYPLKVRRLYLIFLSWFLPWRFSLAVGLGFEIYMDVIECIDGMITNIYPTSNFYHQRNLIRSWFLWCILIHDEPNLWKLRHRKSTKWKTSAEIRPANTIMNLKPLTVRPRDSLMTIKWLICALKPN